jgi:N-acetylmuramoyl-L-alanine amidase
MHSFKQKYPIIPRYLTGPSLRRPCIQLNTCLFLVSHDSGNPGSTAANNVSYYERSRNEQEASAHIFVDDVEIIECIPFLMAAPEKAWHVQYNPGIDNQMFGDDANDAAGGVELCYGGGINLYEAYRRYVWVLAYSCYKYGLDPAQHITGHYKLDPARKVDPMNAFRILGITFEQFVQDVVCEYKECLEEEPMLKPWVYETIHGTWLEPAYEEAKQKGDQETMDNMKLLAKELRAAAGIPEE